jgi:hypothetical protein
MLFPERDHRLLRRRESCVRLDVFLRVHDLLLSQLVNISMKTLDLPSNVLVQFKGNTVMNGDADGVISHPVRESQMCQNWEYKRQTHALKHASPKLVVLQHSQRDCPLEVIF